MTVADVDEKISSHPNGSLPPHFIKEDETKTEEFNKQKTTYWEALVHMFRGTVGTGILALPAAFGQAGYLGGLLGVVAITFLTNHCSVMLANCQAELSRRRKGNPNLTYQAAVQAAFEDGPKFSRSWAPFFMQLTNILILIGQLGGVCAYVIFIASNVKAVSDPYIGEYTIREYTIMLIIPLLAINMVISLKRLAVISTFGNLILLSSVISVLYYTTQGTSHFADRRMFGDVNKIPTCVGTIFFASGCITLILPLRHEMKSPDRLTSPGGVLNINAVLVCIIYCFFGFMGYFKYGSTAKASVTLNLPENEILAQMVQVFLALSTMTATALQNYISVVIIWEDYLSSIIKERVLLTQYALRAFVVMFTVVISLLVPNLELVMSIMGVIGQCTLATTMPCIIHILVFSGKGRTPLEYLRMFFMDGIILLFCFFILSFSLHSAIKNILES